MVKLRVEGLPEEVEEKLKVFRLEFSVLLESGQYKNRNSEYVRVYIEVE